MDKPLLCGKTAKDYKFWDNLMYHYKTLYPLYDKKVDFAQYTSVHDGWLEDDLDSVPNPEVKKS